MPPIHTVTQAIDLPMPDRDAYVGDPAFVDVPLEVLLSKDFADTRRAAMTDKAFTSLPGPGLLTPSPSASRPDPLSGLSPAEALFSLADFSIGRDTNQLVVIDAQGNAVVMTPSDFPQTPMIPGTGLNLGNRMNQFRLDPNSVNALQPGKRPHITPHAVVLFKDGKFFMALSRYGRTR